MKNSILLTLLFVASCSFVKVYKTKDIRDQVDPYLNTIVKNDKMMREDLKLKKEIMTEIDNGGFKKKDIILPKLDKNLQACKKVRGKFDSQKKDFQKHYNALPLAKRKEIRSDDPAFAQVNQFVEYSRQINEEMAKTIEQYNSTCSGFYKILNDHKINVVNASQVKKQFDNSLEKFNRAQGAVTKELGRAKKEITASKHERKQELLKGLRELEGILKIINSQKPPILEAVNNFHSRHGKKKKVLYGDGTPLHADVTKLESTSKKLSEQMARFNSKAKELQRIAQPPKED